jgi:hypothetical protein
MATRSQPVSVTTDTDWPRLLDEAAAAPVRLERDGVVFRLSREESDIGYEPDPELVRTTLAQTIGSWADLDVDQVKRDIYEARRAGSRPAERP